MKQHSYYVLGFSLIAAVLIVTVAAYPHLPQDVPVHWDLQGHPNGWEAKWKLLVIDPAIMAAIMLLFYVLPWLSPKRFDLDSFESTYLFIMVAIVALLACINASMLAAALSWRIDVARTAVGAVCLLTALLGNVLGKVRRNFYIGIRTPWTIADERVWNKTHRLAAKICFAAGWVGLLEVLLSAWLWLPIATVMAAPFIPAIYSLVYYKQLERRGELNQAN
jgi:uncharacterized membrane protein